MGGKGEPKTYDFVGGFLQRECNQRLCEYSEKNFKFEQQVEFLEQILADISGNLSTDAY